MRGVDSLSPMPLEISPLEPGGEPVKLSMLGFFQLKARPSPRLALSFPSAHNVAGTDRS